jgi:hypothetical protein
MGCVKHDVMGCVKHDVMGCVKHDVMGCVKHDVMGCVKHGQAGSQPAAVFTPAYCGGIMGIMPAGVICIMAPEAIII